MCNATSKSLTGRISIFCTIINYTGLDLWLNKTHRATQKIFLLSFPLLKLVEILFCRFHLAYWLKKEHLIHNRAFFYRNSKPYSWSRTGTRSCISVKIMRFQGTNYVCNNIFIHAKSNEKVNKIRRFSTRLFSATRASIFCWFSSSGRRRSESPILATSQKETKIMDKHASLKKKTQNNYIISDINNI